MKLVRYNGGHIDVVQDGLVYDISAAPESENTCLYYVGFSYDPAEMTEEAADFVFDSVFKIFLEDVAILEAQQKQIDLIPGRKTIDIFSDSAGIQAMRALRNWSPQRAVSQRRLVRPSTYRPLDSVA